MKTKWFIYLVVALFSFGFVACGGDDDDDSNMNSSSDIRNKIIGSWYASDNSVHRTVTVTFKKDGTGELYSEYHGPNYHSNSTLTGYFTWSCNGNTVITIGQYVYVDLDDGTVDTDYSPEVTYQYDGKNLIGGRYSGDASVYHKVQ